MNQAGSNFLHCPSFSGTKREIGGLDSLHQFCLTSLYPDGSMSMHICSMRIDVLFASENSSWQLVFGLTALVCFTNESYIYADTCCKRYVVGSSNIKILLICITNQVSSHCNAEILRCAAQTPQTQNPSGAHIRLLSNKISNNLGVSEIRPEITPSFLFI